MYDYDRRPQKRSFNLQIHAGVGMPLGQLTKLFVDGEQLGLLTSLEMRVTASNRDQFLRIGVLEDFTPEAWARCSADLQRNARKVIAKLREFPVIEVVCPEFIT